MFEVVAICFIDMDWSVKCSQSYQKLMYLQHVPELVLLCVHGSIAHSWQLLNLLSSMYMYIPLGCGTGLSYWKVAKLPFTRTRSIAKYSTRYTRYSGDAFKTWCPRRCSCQGLLVAVIPGILHSTGMHMSSDRLYP